MKDEIQKSYGAFSFWQSSERKQEGDRTQHGEHDRNKQWFASRKANREEKGESAWQTQDGVAEILAAGRSLAPPPRSRANSIDWRSTTERVRRGTASFKV